MYHPQVYHTGQCDKWDDKDVRRWRCVWKRRCAHAHGRVDARSKEEATEEWKEHIRHAVGPAAAPSLIARLSHPQGPQAAGNIAHAASAPLSINESEEHGRHTPVGNTNAMGRQSVNGGHARSVSQPVEMLGHSHYGGQQSAAINLNASSPTHAQQMGMTLQARSHSQHVLQLPANSSHNNSTALSPTVSPNHNHKGRISPRPLSIPSPVPSNHSSTGASPSPHSLPATPTSASSSVSLSLFDIHASSDASSRLWGSPHAASSHSIGGAAGSVDDSALHHTVGWNAPKSVPVVKNHHRRSVTMNDAFNVSSSFLYNNSNSANSAFPPPKTPLALHIPSTAANSSSPSVLSSSSASPSHLVPRNLFSNTSSLNASQVASPTGRQAAGRLLEEMRRMDGSGERVEEEQGGMSGGGGSSGRGQLVDGDGSLLRQLEGLLACPFSLTSCSTRPHLLHQPVLMPCCGVAVCEGCAGLYVSCNDEQSCSCGRRYNDWERQQLNAQPTQRLLQQITSLLSDNREGRS